MKNILNKFFLLLVLILSGCGQESRAVEYEFQIGRAHGLNSSHAT